MERAVKVMMDSVREPRDDGKAVPFVGAVLWKSDGTAETAYRGELRDGDHAEFTLLERKNISCKLDDAVLFSTLEPCAPNSRKPPKLGCAERIALARIKQVWVGIEDPDPTVDRKGIKYLQEKGVEVQMFDLDLQERIQDANRDFIDQAEERATAAKEKKSKEVKLSDLEDAESAIAWGDLSQEALEEYRALAYIDEEVDSPAFQRRLLLQGLLKKEKKVLTPTRSGVLLFGKDPRLTMPESGLLGTIRYPNGTEEARNFEGPMVLIPTEFEQWLRDKLPNVIDRGKMQREEVSPLPFEMIREAVVNALVHRDYAIREAKCHVVVTPETVTVKSPGEPVRPITLAQLQKLEAPMLSRNPRLHYVLARMRLAEERGFGLRSLRMGAREAGLPLPRYAWDDPYLVLTLYRNREAAVGTLPMDVAAKLNTDEKAAWQFIATNESVTNRELRDRLDFSERKAQRVLKKLAEVRLVERVGKGRATRYQVVLS